MKGIHDIALIHLRRSEGGVIYNQFTQPICLPSESTVQHGKECLISGWGKTETGSKDNLKIFTYVRGGGCCMYVCM